MFEIKEIHTNLSHQKLANKAHSSEEETRYPSAKELLMKQSLHTAVNSNIKTKTSD